MNKTMNKNNQSVHIKIKDFNGLSLIHEETLLSQEKDLILASLKDNPRWVRWKTSRDENALMIAIIKGHSWLVSPLLEVGMDLSEKDDKGMTALMHAAEKGSVEVVKKLIQRGADLDDQTEKDWNQRGESALICAVDKNHKEVVSTLIEKGARLNGQDQKGNTALMICIGQSDELMLDLLLSAGADTSIKNDKGLTVRDLVKRSGNTQFLECLDRHEALRERNALEAFLQKSDSASKSQRL